MTLGVATEWSATLYNSNGVTVAQQQGSGNEIFLSADSKGTHILVVKSGGKVVKKKVRCGNFYSSYDRVNCS